MTSHVPNNGTAFERALEQALRFDPLIWRASDQLGLIKRNPPPTAFAFLVWEYGLEELLPYISDYEQLLLEGRAWQRIRGTPASIHQALGWIGMQAFVEEDPRGSWWDMFQLGLDARPSVESLLNLIALTRLSKAAHTDLVRIYYAWDIRPLRLDEHRLDGGGYLEDWSGRIIQDGWPKLSFGDSYSERFSLALTQAMRADCIISIEQAQRVTDGDGWILGMDRADAAPRLEPFTQFAFTTAEQIQQADLDRNAAHWPSSPWSARWGLAQTQVAIVPWQDTWPYGAWPGADTFTNFSGVIYVD